MATLLMSRQEVKQAIETRIRVGNDLVAKAEVAERTGGYRDWLHLVSTWRKDTIEALDRLYDGREIGQEFAFMSEASERSSPMYTFPYAKTRLEQGVRHLQILIERLELAVGASLDATALESLHPEIYSKCRKLYESGDYAEAVEKGFKIVRDRLRAITGYETGSEAFGKGSLYIDGAAASHVDDDFQNGVKFLAMAIDRFRNEKSHTADGNISDPIRAYEYLRLSSLAMHLLEGVQVRSSE
ncbi:MAG TPA: TIGR02391 family protein [Solirubrobacteraceae bacterium]|nr:TIGR02391 family protein [Solirubrobacteraceae bacterium]